MIPSSRTIAERPSPTPVRVTWRGERVASSNNLIPPSAAHAAVNFGALMNTRISVIFAATLALVLSACVPSLNPYFTANDVVSDPRLVGEWKADDGSMSWAFAVAGNQNYALTVTEKDEKHGTFVAHLFKIGNETFLDLIPDKCKFAADQSDLVAMAVFPGHLLAHVLAIEPKLKIALIDWDWLSKFLQKNPAALAHHVENKEQIILTAETRDLQRFITAHLGQGELFGEVCAFLRIEPADATAAAQPVAPKP